MSKAQQHGLDVFYPIVPDATWVARIVPLGVRTLQLRVKGVSADDVRRQIDESLVIARRHGCQLIVNDYWREAINAGADYVHLGQEDLAAADVAAIKAAGMRLGVSTHSEEELDVALAIGPDYVALGPIYETKLKAMQWAPQGLVAYRDVEIPRRPAAARRHRRYHARACRRRCRGRRRLRRSNYRLYDSPTPCSPHRIVACVGCDQA